MSSKDPRPATREAGPASAAGASLSARARDHRHRWEAALAQCGSRPAALDPDALSAQIVEAGRNAAGRIALAMIQEGLLRAENLDSDAARVRIPQPDGEDSTLVVSGLGRSSPSLFPELRLFRQELEQPRATIGDSIELLEFVAPAISDAPLHDLARLADELIDALLNDALCGTYRAAWNARLRESIRASRRSTFWDRLKDAPDQTDQALMLEQWSAVGHPYHPTHKTRLGMTPADVLSFCPEFEPLVQIGLVAARRERTAGETMPGTSAGALWLDQHFPAQAEAWRNGLAEQGRDPADYVAIPVHPWQLRHEIPQRFRRSIAKGDLVPVPGPTIPAAPTVSVRTLVPATGPDAPHLKLSLGVRLTSVARTISPRSCEMGPRISKLLQDLIESDAELSSGLSILPEEAGLYYVSAEPDEREESRHLAALLRRNPARYCGSDDILIPTTALTVASPMTGAPLFLELSEAGEDAAPDALRTQLAHYAETLLRPLLTLYLRYGIGLEAHQQNTLALYSRAGRLQRLLFRDFGGIRIHEPSFRAAGLELEVHPDRLTVVDDRAAVRKNLTSRTLHYHLGFLISRICRHLRTSEGPFWSDIAEVVETILNDLQGDVAAATWRRERAALLDDDWAYKASLRMRMEDRSGDVYGPGTNPLRWRGFTKVQ